MDINSRATRKFATTWHAHLVVSRYSLHHEIAQAKHSPPWYVVFYSISPNKRNGANQCTFFAYPSLTQGVKFWNPILIATFSGSLFLFSQAFLPPGLYDYHLTFSNLTKSYEAGHFDSTLNLSTAKPGVLQKASLQIRDLVDGIDTSDMPSIFLESDPLQLGRGSSQVVTPHLAPVTRNDLWYCDIKRSFSSRFLSNSPKSRPSYLNLIGESIDNIYDSESMHVYDPGYDPLELEPFFSTEESGDRGQIFPLKIWLDPKDFSQAKIGKVEICQASHGVKCWPDSPTHHGV